jgi:hypothetical protein
MRRKDHILFLANGIIIASIRQHYKKIVEERRIEIFDEKRDHWVISSGLSEYPFLRG